MNAFEADMGGLGMDLDDPFEDSTILKKPTKQKPPVPKPSLPGQSPIAPAKTALPQPRRAGATASPTPPYSVSGPPRRRPEKKTPSSAPSLSEEQAQSVYRRYLAARKKCNESIDNITYEAVAKSLNAKRNAQGGNVEFKVVIRRGKAVIKTVKTGE